MKPGSSERCKSRNGDVTLRCHRRIGHEGLHQAPRGKLTIRWSDAPKAVSA